jgi:hypothetical protein
MGPRYPHSACWMIPGGPSVGPDLTHLPSQEISLARELLYAAALVLERDGPLQCLSAQTLLDRLPGVPPLEVSSLDPSRTP